MRNPEAHLDRREGCRKHCALDGIRIPSRRQHTVRRRESTMKTRVSAGRAIRASVGDLGSCMPCGLVCSPRWGESGRRGCDEAGGRIRGARGASGEGIPQLVRSLCFWGRTQVKRILEMVFDCDFLGSEGGGPHHPGACRMRPSDKHDPRPEALILVIFRLETGIPPESKDRSKHQAKRVRRSPGGTPHVFRRSGPRATSRINQPGVMGKPSRYRGEDSQV